MSLNGDGTIVAISSPGHHGSNGLKRRSGHVRVFKWNEDTDDWFQLGIAIDGEATKDWSGGSVSLSGDGTIVAIGAIYNDGNNESNSRTGHVRVFKWNEDTDKWFQLGIDICGEDPDDHSGSSVSLSDDGTIVAIGARRNDGNEGSHPNSGHVRVFKWNGDKWFQLGIDIDGEEDDDELGSAVSLSSDDGTIVAIGSVYGKYVRVYQWVNEEWTQLGSDIDRVDDNYVSSVSLSNDGTLLAVGYKTSNKAQGCIVYEWDEKEWVPLGEPTLLNGGHNVCLRVDSNNKIILATGVWFDETQPNHIGQVTIYHLLPTQTAASSGDPYIYPVEGPITKLPNQPGTYRMFQHRTRGTYVDATVRKFAIDIPPEADLGWAHPINQGYFIDTIRIYQGDGHVQVVDVSNNTCFARAELPWVTDTVHNGLATSDTVDMGGMFTGTYQSRVLNIDQIGRVEIRIFDNKQIMNALIWTLPEKSDDIDGLLYKNYRAKFFESSGKNKEKPFIRLPSKPGTQLLTQRSIVGHNEIEVSVKNPLAFKAIFC